MYIEKIKWKWNLSIEYNILHTLDRHIIGLHRYFTAPNRFYLYSFFVWEFTILLVRILYPNTLIKAILLSLPHTQPLSHYNSKNYEFSHQPCQWTVKFKTIGLEYTWRRAAFGDEVNAARMPSGLGGGSTNTTCSLYSS